MSDRIDWAKAYRTYAKSGASAEDIARALGRPVQEVKDFMAAEGMAAQTPPEEGEKPKRTPKTRRSRKPKEAPKAKDEPRSSKDVTEEDKPSRYVDDTTGIPRTFKQALKKSVAKHIDDTYGTGLRKLLKGGLEISRKELAKRAAEGLEQNYGYAGQWLGSRIRDRSGLRQLGEHFNTGQQAAAAAGDVTGVTKSVAQVLSKVGYGVRQSTETIVKAVDRITAGLKSEGYARKESEYESRVEGETRTNVASPDSGGSTGGKMALAAGLGLAGGAAASTMLPGQASAEPIGAVPEPKQEKADPDEIEFKATSIEFKADRADFGGVKVPVAGGGGSGGGGGGGPVGSGRPNAWVHGNDPGGNPWIRPGRGWGRWAPKKEPDDNGPGAHGGSGGGGARGGGGDATPSGPGPVSGGPVGDMIGAGEGGYGSYNRGMAGDTRDQLDPDMTIGELMRRQALPKGHPDRILAAGKYQVIPSTMKEAAAALGLDPNGKFDPETQERINREYLLDKKRPQVKDYITGDGDLGAAQLALAQEFASVADPRTGGSYYGGVGNNRASISSDRAARALQAEREQYQRNIASGMDPDEAWRSLSPAAQQEVPSQMANTDGLMAARMGDLSGPVNAGIMGGNGPGLNNAMMSQRVLEGAWPVPAPASPPTPPGFDPSRFGGSMVQTPPPAVTDYISRTYTDLKAGESKPQVIDAGPEPKVKATVDGREQTALDTEPPATSRKDHFEEFPGIGNNSIPGLGK